MGDIFDNLLLTLALGGLAVSGLLFASALLYPYLRDAWNAATNLARAAFCGAVVVACLFGGAKGKITYPKTDTDLAYLTDAGSYVTNDAVHVAFTRVPTVPDSATFYLDYCAIDGTNSAGVATNWVNALAATFADLSVPFDFAFAAATNFNWVAYTDWTPGPAVQTNGVWHAYWGVDKKEGRYFIPVRTCVRDNGSVIATPKSKWDAKDPMELTEAEAYERYAPDTAYVVNVEAGDYVDVRPLYWVGGTTAADKWVDWGDGTREVFTGDHPKHTYEAAGNYVIRLSGNCTWFRAGRYLSEMVGHKYIVRVLRFGDNVNYFSQLFTECTRATCFPDGKLPRWPKAAASVKAFYDVYQGCTSLAPKELPAWPTGLTSIGNVYQGCTSLAPTELPAWPTGLTSIGNVYYDCTSLAVTSIPDWPDSCEYIGHVFRQCSKMALTKLPEWPKSLKKIGGDSTYWESVYWRCYAIKTDKIPEWPEGLTSANGVYCDCRGITGTIPKWPANATQMSYIYNGCKNLTGAWTSDPAELMPTNITSHSGCVSGASDAVRELFYSDWGGTRTKTE